MEVSKREAQFSIPVKGAALAAALFIINAEGETRNVEG
jgi:hypothetical protein